MSFLVKKFLDLVNLVTGGASESIMDELSSKSMARKYCDAKIGAK